MLCRPARGHPAQRSEENSTVLAEKGVDSLDGPCRPVTDEEAPMAPQSPGGLEPGVPSSQRARLVVTRGHFDPRFTLASPLPNLPPLNSAIATMGLGAGVASHQKTELVS